MWLIQSISPHDFRFFCSIFSSFFGFSLGVCPCGLHSLLFSAWVQECLEGFWKPLNDCLDFSDPVEMSALPCCSCYSAIRHLTFFFINFFALIFAFVVFLLVFFLTPRKELEKKPWSNRNNNKFTWAQKRLNQQPCILCLHRCNDVIFFMLPLWRPSGESFSSCATDSVMSVGVRTAERHLWDRQIPLSSLDSGNCQSLVPSCSWERLESQPSLFDEDLACACVRIHTGSWPFGLFFSSVSAIFPGHTVEDGSF